MNEPEIPRSTDSEEATRPINWGAIGGKAIVGKASIISLVLWLVPDHLNLLSGDFLVCSPNTFRDFEVYRWVRMGWLPFEGPSTSIGGHHGYLSYWIFGAIHAIWPTFEALQGFGLVVLVLTLLGSGALAVRVSGLTNGLVGLGVYLASPILFLIHYPNHIVLIPVATCLTLYGFLRSREHWAWSLLASIGLVAAIGAHRTGWLLLAVVVVLDLRFRMGWLRKGLSLLPIGIALIPEVISRVVVESPSGQEGMSFFGDLDPLLVLLTMPFHQFKEDGNSPVRWLELAFVIGILVMAYRATTDKREGRVIWWFYAVHFALYPWYRFDLQYYMGMFAALPALIGLAFYGLEGENVEWNAPAIGGVLAALILANGWSMHQQVLHFQQPESKHFRSIQPELQAIQALDEAGASPREVLTCSTFPEFNRREFRVFYTTFSTAVDPEKPEAMQRFEIDWEGSSPTSSSLSVRAIPAPAKCKRAAKSYSERLLYWNPSTGEMKQQ